MFFNIHFPISDQRVILSNAKKLPVPAWTGSVNGKAFIRRFGAMKKRPLGGSVHFEGEGTFCDAENLLSFLPVNQVENVFSPVFKRFYSDGCFMNKMEVGFRLTNPYFKNGDLETILQAAFSQQVRINIYDREKADTTLFAAGRRLRDAYIESTTEYGHLKQEMYHSAQHGEPVGILIYQQDGYTKIPGGARKVDLQYNYTLPFQPNLHSYQLVLPGTTMNMWLIGIPAYEEKKVMLKIRKQEKELREINKQIGYTRAEVFCAGNLLRHSDHSANDAFRDDRSEQLRSLRYARRRLRKKEISPKGELALASSEKNALAVSIRDLRLIFAKLHSEKETIRLLLNFLKDKREPIAEKDSIEARRVSNYLERTTRNFFKKQRHNISQQDIVSLVLENGGIMNREEFNTMIRETDFMSDYLKQNLTNIINNYITNNNDMSTHNHFTFNNSTIENSFNNSFNTITENHGPEVADAMKKLMEHVDSLNNKDAADSAAQLAELVKEKDPKKGLIKTIWNGLVAMAPTVKTLTEITAIITKFFI
ncbi:MAG: hypothetical protein ACJ77K_00435 [Bacteroidia bacterium]